MFHLKIKIKNSQNSYTFLIKLFLQSNINIICQFMNNTFNALAVTNNTPTFIHWYINFIAYQKTSLHSYFIKLTIYHPYFLLCSELFKQFLLWPSSGVCGIIRVIYYEITYKWPEGTGSKQRTKNNIDEENSPNRKINYNKQNSDNIFVL